MTSLVVLYCCNFAVAQEPAPRAAPSGLAPVVKDFCHGSRFALSADSKCLLVASGDGATQWDLTTGRILHTYKGHKDRSLGCVALSSDGKLALTGSDDGAILWDADRGARRFVCTGHRGIRAVAFSKDDKLALVGSQDGSASLWRTDSGTRVQTFKGDVGVITSVDLFPFGKEGGFVLTGTLQRGAILWDMKTGQRLKRSFGKANFSVDAAMFSPQRFFVAIAGERQVLLFKLDARKGDEPFKTFKHKEPVGGLSLSADGKLLAAGCADGYAYLWEIDRDKKVPRTFAHHYNTIAAPATKKKANARPNCDGWVGQVGLSHDGKRLCTASANAALPGADRITLWDVASGKELVRLYNDNWGKWLVVAPDGRFDGPPEAWKYLSYREVGTNKFVSDDQTRRRFHHPGLLVKVLEVGAK
jgi:WD40 repeat protein